MRIPRVKVEIEDRIVGLDSLEDLSDMICQLYVAVSYQSRLTIVHQQALPR